MSEDVMTASTALSIEKLGRLIAAKRGGHGVRAAAMDVGVSPATLSRVENGHMPDLETFAKICRWLGRDPREFLGLDAEQNSTPISDRLSDDILAELDRQLLHWHEPMLQRARDEIVALRRYKHENHEASEIIRRAAELVRTQKEGGFSDAKREVRDEALEEAARVCDRLATDYTIPMSADNWSAGCRGCAGRIRALKDIP